MRDDKPLRDENIAAEEAGRRFSMSTIVCVAVRSEVTDVCMIDGETRKKTGGSPLPTSQIREESPRPASEATLRKRRDVMR